MNRRCRFSKVVMGVLVIAVFACTGCGVKDLESNMGNNVATQEDGDLKMEKESKLYCVKSKSKLKESDINDIIIVLQERAEKISDKAKVLMHENGDEWYIEISLPGMDDESYQKITGDIDLKFIGGYGTEDEEVIVTGKNIKSAKGVSDNKEGSTTIENIMNITFDDEGKKLFAKGTEKNVDKIIAIVLDGQIVSEQTVIEAISGGKVAIDGFASEDEVKKMASCIRASSLEFDLIEK